MRGQPYMQDWFIIFMYNLFTNIDNAIMIQLSLHKYNLRGKIKFYIFMLLCLLRILSIACVQSMSDVPYINVATALIMFFFAIRMVMPKKMMRRHFTYLFIFSSVAALDLIMSIDSILLTARLSDNLLFIAMGVLPALCLIFLFSSKMEEFIQKMPWIEVAIAGLLAQLAVLQLKKEPDILHLLQEEWFDLMAITAMCIICSVGWFNLWRKTY
ncbi:putative tellurium resistance membrane protein TerC [Paenibacillus sp. V4I3]|uniref:TerC family protein n=1 Tax=unclassified Paenibacillus TaxID=185978 RepID=UPI0027836578|nr:MULTISPECIES: hypothetical protein [unclassified Paenibacillus]MDQ0875612.1 putative tellurium resistance membrane protein TerC [Paenibacillus sp. V4I3]MDQ0888307.1 putative tellurium resistance membrane protein TerC [Paenibacillus sp. V4I9]